MRRLAFILTLTGIVIFSPSCSDDKRNTEPLEDPWLRERTPTAFKLEGQVGPPTIVDNWRNDGQGSIYVTLSLDLIQDISRVSIEQLSLQYNSSSDVSSGSTLDLSDGSASFTVTAESGETRTYTISYGEFEEPLIGIWNMDPIPGKIDPSYGNTAIFMCGGVAGNATWMGLSDKNWNWRDGGWDENDNSFTFTLTDIDSDNGITMGTVYNDPGPDGKYQDFYFTGSGGHDMNYAYRLIPEGTSYWQKDLSTGIVTIFTDADFTDTFFSFDIVETRYVYNDDGNEKVITFNNSAFAVTFDFAGDNWNDPWNDVGRFVDNCRSVIWTVVKAD